MGDQAAGREPAQERFARRTTCSLATIPAHRCSIRSRHRGRGRPDHTPDTALSDVDIPDFGAVLVKSRVRAPCWCGLQLTCEYTETTARGHPCGLVVLNVTSIGKFHTTPLVPVPVPFCATCEKPWSMPARMRQSGPYEKVYLQKRLSSPRNCAWRKGMGGESGRCRFAASVKTGLGMNDEALRPPRTTHLCGLDLPRHHHVESGKAIAGRACLGLATAVGRGAAPAGVEGGEGGRSERRVRATARNAKVRHAKCDAAQEGMCARTFFRGCPVECPYSVKLHRSVRAQRCGRRLWTSGHRRGACAQRRFEADLQRAKAQAPGPLDERSLHPSFHAPLQPHSRGHHKISRYVPRFMIYGTMGGAQLAKSSALRPTVAARKLERRTPPFSAGGLATTAGDTLAAEPRCCPWGVLF
jgi:hypothetical protein